MSELFDADGAPRAVRIELVESSGPVSPRFQHRTLILIEAGPALAPRIVRDHRDVSGERHDERPLGRATYEDIVCGVLRALPLGEARDLTSGKRDRKGISFNHVAITIAAASARLDYLLEDLDEDDGDPQARAVVGAVKAAFIA